jgi:hypothetical protein
MLPFTHYVVDDDPANRFSNIWDLHNGQALLVRNVYVTFRIFRGFTRTLILINRMHTRDSFPVTTSSFRIYHVHIIWGMTLSIQPSSGALSFSIFCQSGCCTFQPLCHCPALMLLWLEWTDLHKELNHRNLVTKRRWASSALWIEKEHKDLTQRQMFKIMARLFKNKFKVNAKIFCNFWFPRLLTYQFWYC